MLVLAGVAGFFYNESAATCAAIAIAMVVGVGLGFFLFSVGNKQSRKVYLEFLSQGRWQSRPPPCGSNRSPRSRSRS